CASWSWDPAKGECLWEEDMYALIGLEEDAFKPTSESFLELVHPEDRDLLAPLFTENSADPSKLSYRLLLPDETELWLLQYSHVIGSEESGDIKRVSICWRIDHYSATPKRQHLTIVPNAAAVSDEEVGE
ncbi:MAG: PAS domain-containing protein, partial [Candidatus Thiodiazotropha sp.]